MSTTTTTTNLACTGSIGCKSRLSLESFDKATWSPARGHVHRALELAGNYLGWRRRGDQILCPVHADGCLEAREL